MTSQARTDANRKNAQKSTGPKTAAGKEKTRLNGLKHGLRSEEVVLPTESRSAFESHMAAWMDDWKPPTETRRFLVERAATAAWRLKRCVRNETNRLSDRALKGYAEWDKAQADRVERAVRRIPKHPEASIHELMATREGLHHLYLLWNDLYIALEEPEGWCDFDTHHNRLCHLLGINGEDDPDHLQAVSRASYGLMLRTNPDDTRDDLPPMSDATADQVRSMLRDLCEAKIKDELQVRINSLPDQSEVRYRYAETRAMESHPEDATYQRYEGRLDREVRATITQLIKLEQTGADLMALDEESEPPSEPIATAVEPPTEAIEAVPAVKAPSEANPTVPETPMIRFDRAQSGGVVPIASVENGPRSLATSLSYR